MRGVSRDSEQRLQNATLGNFGLATQSSRSNSMTTPLMYAQNTQARLRDISKIQVLGVDSLSRDNHLSNSNIISPTAHVTQRIAGNGYHALASRTNYHMAFKRMSQANYAVMKTEQMRLRSSHQTSQNKHHLSIPHSMNLTGQNFTSSRLHSSSRARQRALEGNMRNIDSGAVLL